MDWKRQIEKYVNWRYGQDIRLWIRAYKRDVFNDDASNKLKSAYDETISSILSNVYGGEFLVVVHDANLDGECVPESVAYVFWRPAGKRYSIVAYKQSGENFYSFLDTGNIYDSSYIVLLDWFPRLSVSLGIMC